MQTSLLEAPREHGSMTDRLMEAARRLDGSTEAPGILRPEQGGVYADFAEYMADVATRPNDGAGRAPMGRIVLPPRTGKTVIACRIAMGAGLTTTFIVPTKTLVEQAVAEFRKFLPNVPIGMFCGESKDLVVGGVNVTTYQILQRCMRTDGCLPWQIACSALIFADEGHRAMTRGRLTMLEKGFDPRAVRIALTATPDFDEERTLARFFPELIHEMTVQEAMELKLLAPVRFWLAEVDEDASSVKIVGGELETERLGSLMSAAPFLEAANHYRYGDGNRGRAALICCASRRQAYDLLAYLKARRPEGTPPPKAVVAETPPDERRKALADFESGKVDTLINVGVLLEGWNSPRCKLLIDLAPSLSRVRAMQKFFRPLTKWEQAEAHIYMFVPKNLQQIPIMPLDIFAAPSEGYEAGELMTRTRSDAPPSALKPISKRAKTPIEKVELVSRIAVSGRFERPKLDRKREEQIRAVLESNPEFDPQTDLCGIQRFRWLQFRHPLFTGRGVQLLRYIGVRPDREGFVTFMARLYPESAVRRYMATQHGDCPTDDCRGDAEYLQAQLLEPLPNTVGRQTLRENFLEGWRAAAGSAAGEPPLPLDEELDRRRLMKTIFEEYLPLCGGLDREAFLCGFGLHPRAETMTELGTLFNLSKSRVCQFRDRTIFSMKRWLRQRGYDC